MRAIILAAGRGSRLGSITVDKPKGMTPLLGQPLLAWQIGALRRAGIERIGIVRGYRAEAIDFPGVQTFDNRRWAETNMVVSLRSACSWLEESPCLVSYSDIVYAPGHAAALAACSAPLAITFDQDWQDLWKARFSDPLADAETFRLDSTGRVTEIGKRAASLEDVQGQYMGLIRFTPQSWDHAVAYLDQLPPEWADKLDMTSLLAGLIAQGVPVLGVPVRGRWLEVDNTDDLRLYEGESHPGQRFYWLAGLSSELFSPALG